MALNMDYTFKRFHTDGSLLYHKAGDEFGILYSMTIEIAKSMHLEIPCKTDDRETTVPVEITMCDEGKTATKDGVMEKEKDGPESIELWTRGSDPAIDDEAILLLLEIMARDDIQMAFKGKKKTNASIYRKIAEELVEKGYNLGVNPTKKVADKWGNLKRSHTGFVDHEKKTGEAPIAKPKYFDQIDSIRGKSHSVSPLLVIDSEKPFNIANAKKLLKKKIEISLSEDEDSTSDSFMDTSVTSSPTPGTSTKPVVKKEKRPVLLPRKNTILKHSIDAIGESQEKEDKWRQKTEKFRSDMLKEMKDANEKKNEQAGELLSYFKRLVELEEKKGKRKRSRSPDSD